MASEIMAGLYILLTFSFLLLVWVSIVEIIRAWIAWVKKLIHRRAVDRRIIARAKGAGVWEKPMRLGGRALELRVKQMAGVKRKPGETDAELRRRYELEVLGACAHALGIPTLVLRDEYDRARKKPEPRAGAQDGYRAEIALIDEKNEEEPK